MILVLIRKNDYQDLKQVYIWANVWTSQKKTMPKQHTKKKYNITLVKW